MKPVDAGDRADRAGPLRRRVRRQGRRQLLRDGQPRAGQGADSRRRERSVLRRVSRARDERGAARRRWPHVVPKEGAAGQGDRRAAELADDDRLARLLETDTFRHDLAPATSSQDVWHSAGAGGRLPVLWRRVRAPRDGQLRLGAAAGGCGCAIACCAARTAAPTSKPTMERLRSRKAEVTDQLEQQRAATAVRADGRSAGDVAVARGRAGRGRGSRAADSQASGRWRPTQEARELHRADC